MTKTYKIADKIIEINSVYERVHKLCADYAADGEPDIRISMSDKEIEAERSPEINSSPAYLESLAVYRKIAVAVLDSDTFLMHGSVIAVDGKAYMFTALSGTGKSTHTRLWREMLGERAVMVNDDKPLLKVTDSGVTAYGTPWNGKHHLSANIAVPLAGIALLHRSEQNKIIPAKRADMFPALMQQVYRPHDTVKMARTLELLDKTLDNVRLYELYCNMEPEAAETAYRGMSGNGI